MVNDGAMLLLVRTMRSFNPTSKETMPLATVALGVVKAMAVADDTRISCFQALKQHGLMFNFN